MSDTSNSSDETKSLSPKHATAVSISISNADVVLVFVSALPTFSKRAGLVRGINFESVATVSLSTIATKQLIKQLSAALSEFETVTGHQIPDFGEMSSVDTSSDADLPA